MEQKTIYARALPKSIRLTETYFYEKTIARNPSIQMGRPPTGQIEIVIPYDGYQHFTRQAVKDVEHQLGTPSPKKDLDALIGHLAFSRYGRTNLTQTLGLSDRYGSLPLRVPISGGAITNTERIYSDQHSCIIGFDYDPRPPDTIPTSIDLSLWDEDILSRPSIELANDEGHKLDDVVEQITQQVNFRRNLLILARIALDLPRETLPDGVKPRVMKMSFGWPTITSFRALRLSIGSIPADKESHTIFNPLNRSVEWSDVEMEAIPQTPGTDVQTYATPPMNLLIDHPGELYQEPTLDGQVEIEIPNYLLSGLQVRLFDGTGAFAKDFNPTISTRIVTKFRLVLDEAFVKRTLSPYQHLHFEEVIPDRMRVADIKTALVDRGFRLATEKPLSGRHELQHFLLAERAEGPVSMRLWVFIEGKRYETERQTQVTGGQTYTSTFESGDIKVYMRGEMPGNSRRLIQEMNAFQAALRDRFERLKAKR